MAIRKKTKYLVRFFLSEKAIQHPRKDIEYCGKSLQECISKLNQDAKQYVSSFTIYVNGEKKLNVPTNLYGNLL